MMKHKKWIHMLCLGLCLLCLLSGCISVSRTDRQSLSEAEEIMEDQPEDTEAYTVVYAHKSMNTYFHQLLNASVLTYTQQQGWSYELAVADYDQLRQNQQITNFLAKNPDVIVTSSVDQEKIGPAVEAVKSAGTPIVCIDTGTVSGEPDLTIQFDNYQAGQMAAEEIVRLLTEKNGEPQGVVVHGYGMSESSAWVARKQGFEAVMTQYPDILCLDEGVEGNPENAREFLAGILAQQSVDAVHCSSDHPARGFVQALQQAGQWEKIGEDGHIIFVTIDGDPFAAEQVRNGYYDGSIVQDAVGYGKVLIQLLEQYIFADSPILPGFYQVDGTWWDYYQVSETAGGMLAVIPPYILNRKNADDQKHWSWIAQEQWGYEYR